MFFDTIAAVGTPHGKGGVSMIRVSGSEAFSAAKKVFLPKNRNIVLEEHERKAIYGEFLDENGTIFDDGIMVLYKGPASFTGEDMVEFFCHGSPVGTSILLDSILKCNVRQALAGEFTKRSFLNGKSSLTAVEGIADLLEAKSESAAILSSSVARGKLQEYIDSISSELLKITSSLFVYVDYPDEDMQEISDDEILLDLDSLKGKCRDLINSFKIGKAITEGVSAAIVGKPNVGKSSLFNALLKEECAIVSEYAGTTRDVIEYPLKLGKIILRLSDTAGIRKNTSDVIEKIGINLSLDKIEKETTKLIFALFDSSKELDEDDFEIISKLKGSAAIVIAIITKTDLERKIDEKIIRENFENVFAVSLKNNPDFTDVSNKIDELFSIGKDDLSDGKILINTRQKDLLSKALSFIEDAVYNLENQSKDIACVLLQSALAQLSEVEGREISEVIVEDIFSRFCVGK